MLFDDLVDALKKTGIPFEKYGWRERPKGDYGQIALDGTADAVFADGQLSDRAVEGTIDLFTSRESRDKARLVESVLNQMDGVAWYLESNRYERGTQLLHREWVFSLERE